MTFLLRVVLALLFTTLASASVRAQHASFTHTVRDGETLASIAERYYGNPKYESLLVAENGLDVKGGSVVVTGMRLTIPWATYYVVEAEDTWRSIASQMYGNPDRSFVLTEANSSAKAEEGSQILIPHPLRHVASQGQTLNDVVKLYFDKPGRAYRAVRRFNDLKSPKLTQGQIVLVPMTDLQLSEEGRTLVELALGTQIATGEMRRAQDSINVALPEIADLIRGGKYLKALARASFLLGGGHATTGQQVRLWHQVAVSKIALSDREGAVGAFDKLLSIDPNFELPEVVTPPKVLDAFEDARKIVAKRTAQAEAAAAKTAQADAGTQP